MKKSPSWALPFSKIWGVIKGQQRKQHSGPMAGKHRSRWHPILISKKARCRVDVPPHTSKGFEPSLPEVSHPCHLQTSHCCPSKQGKVQKTKPFVHPQKVLEYPTEYTFLARPSRPASLAVRLQLVRELKEQILIVDDLELSDVSLRLQLLR